MACLFPNHCFGCIEYTQHLLLSGEEVKAQENLNHATMLSETEPERKNFHISEWKAFCYVLTRFWIQKEDFSKARLYLDIEPSSPSISELEKRMAQRLVLHFTEKNLQKITGSEKRSRWLMQKKLMDKESLRFERLLQSKSF